MALYSWRPDRKATREHIHHFVTKAVERKQWAATMPANPDDWPASEVSRDMLRNYRSKTVKQLARDSLDYARLRAFMRGAYDGYPGDRPARDLWEKLANVN